MVSARFRAGTLGKRTLGARTKFAQALSGLKTSYSKYLKKKKKIYSVSSKHIVAAELWEPSGLVRRYNSKQGTSV